MLPDFRVLSSHGWEERPAALEQKCYILIQPNQKGERSYLLQKRGTATGHSGIEKLKLLSYPIEELGFGKVKNIAEVRNIVGFSFMAKDCGWQEGYNTGRAMLKNLTAPDHIDSSGNYKKLTYENKIIYHITADATPENIKDMVNKAGLTAIAEGEVINLVYSHPSSHSLMGAKVGKSLSRIFHMVYGEPYSQSVEMAPAPISAIPVPASEEKAKSGWVVALPLYGTSGLADHSKDTLESESKRLKVNSSEVPVFAAPGPVLDKLDSLPVDRGYPPGFPSNFMPSAPPAVAQEEAWEPYDSLVWEQGVRQIEEKEPSKCGCCIPRSHDS